MLSSCGNVMKISYSLLTETVVHYYLYYGDMDPVILNVIEYTVLYLVDLFKSIIPCMQNMFYMTSPMLCPSRIEGIFDIRSLFKTTNTRSLSAQHLIMVASTLEAGISLHCSLDEERFPNLAVLGADLSSIDKSIPELIQHSIRVRPPVS